MRFAVRASYPEEGRFDWAEKVRAAEPVGWVEVAFADPDRFGEIPIDRVAAPFEDASVRVAAVHMATARVAERDQFRQVLEKTLDLSTRLGTTRIVAHPNRGRLSDVRSLLDDEISPLLESRGARLCWETFEGRRRIFAGLGDIVAFCRERPAFRACYDFSHVSGSHEEVEAQITQNLEWIEHFHLSNRVRAGRIQHLPVFWNEEAGEFGRDLDLAALLGRLATEGYRGTLTLEYQDQFEDRLVPDALRLVDRFGV